MNPLVVVCAVSGAFLAALMVLAPSGRARGLAPVLAVGAIITGLVMRFLIPADLLHLPAWTGLGRESADLVGWALWVAAARRSRRPWLPGPPALAAWLAGALFGEIAGAALVAGAEPDKGRAARLAMAAAAGGLVGRVGDPALLVLGDRISVASLLPLSLLLLALAKPGGDPQPDGSRAVTGLGLVVACCAGLFPVAAPYALVGGAALLLALGRSEQRISVWSEVAWTLAGLVLALITAASGLWELAAESLEQIAGIWGSIPMGLVALVSGLAAMLIDGPATGICAAALAERAMDLRSPGFALALAIGSAVGGIGPLAVVRASRRGARRWLLGVVIAAIYAAVLARWQPAP